MKRLGLAVTLALFGHTMPGSAIAQQSSATAEINTLINNAFGELTDLQESYFDIRGKLVDWENSARRTDRSGSYGASTDNAEFRELASTIVEHPLVPLASVQCREHLGALLTPGNVVDGPSVLACGNAIAPRVRHSESYECSSLFWSVDPSGVLRASVVITEGTRATCPSYSTSNVIRASSCPVTGLKSTFASPRSLERNRLPFVVVVSSTKAEVTVWPVATSIKLASNCTSVGGS